MAERTESGTVYELTGPHDAPVVALIHGLGLNRTVWQWHLPALSARYRVLIYDLYGHGESGPPPAQPSLTLFSTQFKQLLTYLGVERCAIVGFSLGGMINRRFAIDHPARVVALAILNSPHERTVEAQATVERRAAETAMGGPAVTLDATIDRWFTAGFQAARPEIIVRVRQWVLANNPQVYAECRQVLARGVAELIRPKPSIAKPTLVMTAEHDSGSTPAMTHAIAAETPGAEAIVIPHLKHMALVEAPSLFSEPLLGFLARTPY